MRRTCRPERVLAIVVGVLTAALAFGQRLGDLVVTPPRLNLSDGARAGSITVVNRGAQSVRYRLNLVDMEMSEDGILARLTVPTTNSAAPYLRLSPREFVLGPGESQTIRILASVPTNLDDTELRSHLAFEPISNRAGQASLPVDGSGLKINLETRTAVSIPVIYEHGKLAAKTSVSDAKVVKEGGRWLAKCRLNREGKRTLRGDLNVTFFPAGGGKPVALAHVSGLPVYFPNNDRLVRVPLAVDPTTLGKGEIEFKYAETERGKAGAFSRIGISAPS